VIGSSWVGKSTFINTLFKDHRANVCHGWTSAKSESVGLVPIIGTLPSDHTRRLVIVDTPGFNWEGVTISDILNRLSAWLKASYVEEAYIDMKLAGILYLHEISLRPPGPDGTVTNSDLKTIRKLCGKNFGAPPVVLGVSNWKERVTTGNANLNKMKDVCWRLLIEQGCSVVQLQSTDEFAWEMVNSFLSDAEYRDFRSAHNFFADVRKEYR
ncbi:hypothetical protein BDQ17DRAFT_1452895, partial [Cyathus striatus]